MSSRVDVQAKVLLTEAMDPGPLTQTCRTPGRALPNPVHPHTNVQDVRRPIRAKSVDPRATRAISQQSVLSPQSHLEI